MKPQSPTVSAGGGKRARGRPRKTRPTIIDPATPPIPSVDDGSVAPRQQQADAAPAKIDKSKLTFGSHVDCATRPTSNSWPRCHA